MEPELNGKIIAIENEETIDLTYIEQELENFDTLIIALFVPKAKPMNNFDISPVILELLSSLLESKKCILYVFGNPYALQVIPNFNLATGIVQAYQDFPEFQENAAEQLLNDYLCSGVLPVHLNGI